MAPKKQRAKAPPKKRAPKAPSAPKLIHVRAKQSGTYGTTLYNPGDVFLIEEPAKGQELPAWVEALTDKEVKALAEAAKKAAARAAEAQEIG